MPSKPSKPKNLMFPMGGLSRRYSYQSQPPYTTPDAQNVRPDGTLEDRTRGGSRPGLIKSQYDELGSGAPVRMLAVLDHLDTSGAKVWEDNFSGTTVGDIWTNWLGAVTETDGKITVGYGDQVIAFRDLLSDIDVSQDYVASMYVIPYRGSHGGIYAINVMMPDSDSSPMPKTWCEVSLEMNAAGDPGYCAITKYVTATPTSIDTGHTADTPENAGWFTVHVSGTTVKGYWRGEELVSGTVSGLSGSRVGFAITGPTATAQYSLVDSFLVEYVSTSLFQDTKRTLFASAGGDLYKQTRVSKMTAISSNLSLADDRQLFAVPAYDKNTGQVLVIADNGYKTSGTGATVDTTGVNVWKAALDWDDYGISVYDDVIVLTTTAGACVSGTYTIASVTAGAGNDLALTGTGAIGDGTADWSVGRGVKVYDPSLGTIALLVATTGSVPLGCKLIAYYRDRIVLAGAESNPHLWYMCRQGDIYDWNFSGAPSDAARAVAAQNSDAGLLGAPCTALIAHSDDYLVFGAKDSLWVLKGDPAYGGIIYDLSRTVGIVSQGAWCRLPDGGTIFLSQDGLYFLAAGAEAYPQSLSGEKLPQDLKQVSTQLTDVSMAYDVQAGGVHIFLTSKDVRQKKHWYFDLQTASFWPVTVPANREASSILTFTGDVDEEKCVLIGGRDGYIRRFFGLAESDDGTAITSYVDIGPIKLGKDGHDGMLVALRGNIAKDSGDVTMELRVGDNAESAYNASAVETKTWVAGQNYRTVLRRSGDSMVIRLSSGDDDRSWVMENVIAETAIRGPQKLV